LRAISLTSYLFSFARFCFAMVISSIGHRARGEDRGRFPAKSGLAVAVILLKELSEC
jgi:hypothetical protein